MQVGQLQIAAANCYVTSIINVIINWGCTEKNATVVLHDVSIIYVLSSFIFIVFLQVDYLMQLKHISTLFMTLGTV